MPARVWPQTVAKRPRVVWWAEQAGEGTKNHHSQLPLSLNPSHIDHKSSTDWAVSGQKLWTTLGVWQTSLLPPGVF